MKRFVQDHTNHRSRFLQSYWSTLGKLGAIQCPTSFLDFVQRQTRRPGGSLLVCACMGAKLAWPLFLGLHILQGLWVWLTIPCPVGTHKSRCISKSATGHEGMCIHEGWRAYYFRILLHIWKLTSEHLSMLQQPALLMPKSGLWEKSNCLLWVTRELCEW